MTCESCRRARGNTRVAGCRCPRRSSPQRCSKLYAPGRPRHLDLGRADPAGNIVTRQGGRRGCGHTPACAAPASGERGVDTRRRRRPQPRRLAHCQCRPRVVGAWRRARRGGGTRRRAGCRCTEGVARAEGGRPEPRRSARRHRGVAGSGDRAVARGDRCSGGRAERLGGRRSESHRRPDRRDAVDAGAPCRHRSGCGRRRPNGRGAEVAGGRRVRPGPGGLHLPVRGAPGR